MSHPTPNVDLVLGIDGGGTKTVAWLASKKADGDRAVLGRGYGGPGNFQAVGVEAALANLAEAIAGAFEDARLEARPVAAAVIGLAGSDRDENRRALEAWACERDVTRRLRIVNDATPVLAAGSPEGWGVALISGTGSLCFGQAADGRSTRSGGWGYLFGDEGSAYGLAVAGLRAAAKAADGRGPATQLLEGFLHRLGLPDPAGLVRQVYAIAGDRAAVASLAEAVTHAAGSGDPVACQILDDAATELAAMVAAVARSLGFSSAPFPLALTGGVLCGNATLRNELAAHLAALGLSADPVTIVQEPVAGAVKLAQKMAT